MTTAPRDHRCGHHAAGRGRIRVGDNAARFPADDVPATTPASTLPSDGSDDNERTLMFVVLLGIAAVSAGFLVLRSRRTA